MSIRQRKMIKHELSDYESDEIISDLDDYTTSEYESDEIAADDSSSEYESDDTDSISQNRYTLEEILVENSPYNDNKYLIHRLFKNNLLDNKCYKCGRDPAWQEKNLVLQLDHIDGVHNNNSITNLRMLCPNCHSQTSTYAGKNNIKKRKCLSCDTQITGKYDNCDQCYEKNGTRNIIHCNKVNKCDCGNQIWKKSMQCKTCRNIQSRIFNVSKEDLEDMSFVQKLTRTEIAKKYGVSCTTVGQRCKEYKID